MGSETMEAGKKRRMGRPLKPNARRISINLRLSEATMRDLEACALRDNTTRTAIVEKGIAMVKAEK